MKAICLWDKKILEPPDLLNSGGGSSDQTNQILRNYSELAGLVAEPKGAAKKIVKGFQEVDDNLGDLEQAATSCPEAAKVFSIILYDVTVKLELFKDILVKAGAEPRYVEKLRTMWDVTHQKVLEAESSQGLISLASASMNPAQDEISKGETEKADVVAQMNKLLTLMRTEVPKPQLLRFIFETSHPYYTKLIAISKMLLDRVESEPESSESLAELTKYAQLVDVDVLWAIGIIELKMLKEGCNLLVKNREMPKALDMIFGSKWQSATKAELNSRLRELSLVFHPDKNNWQQEYLDEAGVSGGLFQEAQKVLNDATSYMRTIGNTMEEARKLVRQAGMHWKDALEKHELEKASSGEEAAAHFREKAKHAYRAMDSWREAMRIMIEWQAALE
jgi:hypothetical protein